MAAGGHAGEKEACTKALAEAQLICTLSAMHQFFVILDESNQGNVSKEQLGNALALLTERGVNVARPTVLLHGLPDGDLSFEDFVGVMSLADPVATRLGIREMERAVTAKTRFAAPLDPSMHPAAGGYPPDFDLPHGEGAGGGRVRARRCVGTVGAIGGPRRPTYGFLIGPVWGPFSFFPVWNSGSRASILGFRVQVLEFRV